MVAIPPKMKPSQVFFGDISKNLNLNIFLPNKDPKNYAIQSFVTTQSIGTYIHIIPSNNNENACRAGIMIIPAMIIQDI